jgi:hypothetical protein
MGPLSVKADVQAKAGLAKNQMLVIKTLGDEARKKKQAEMKAVHAHELHQVKVAKEVAKAKAEGIPLKEDSIGASDGMLSIPKMGTQQPSTAIKEQPEGIPHPSTTLDNPEAGPSDTVPAMLTPGEAVIPASVAQDSTFKPVIAALVEEGRLRNRQPGGVKGLADGTSSLPPIGTPPKPKSLWESLTSKKAEAPKEEKKEEPKKAGSMVDNAKGVLGGRAAQLADQEKKAMGLADGTSDISMSKQDVMMAESGGNPLARNPQSSATGLYQMIGAAREDVEAVRPDLRRKDFSDPKVQEEYRTTYRTLLTDRLTSSKIDPTEDNLNRAWVVGSAGLAKIANSDPDARLDKVLGSKVTDINPNLRGKTAGEFMRDTNPYSVKGKSEPAYGEIQSPAEASRLNRHASAAIPKVHRRGGTSGFMRDLAQSQLNPVYDAELADRTGDPDGSIARVEEARLANARAVPPVQTKDGIPPVVPGIMAREVVPQSTQATQVTIPQKQGLPEEQINQRMDNILEDPKIKEEINAIAVGGPPKDVEPKSWLAEQIGKVFGKTGMFNEEELIRFSLLAAGGLLTGGSVRGSFRYAGLNTVAASDKRRAEEDMSARQATNQKAVDDRQARQQAQQQRFTLAGDANRHNNDLQKQYFGFMDTATPAARAEAEKAYASAQTAKTLPEREALLSQAIRIVQSNQVPKDEHGNATVPIVGYDSRTGKEVKFLHTGKDKTTLVELPNGTRVPAASVGMNPISMGDYRQREESQLKAISDVLAPKLMVLNRHPGPGGGVIDKDYSDAMIKAQSAGLARAMLGARDMLGHDISDKDWAAISNHTMSVIGEDYSGKKLSSLGPEAIQRVVYGSSVIAMHQTNKSLYTVEGDKGKSKPASTEATAAFGNKVKEYQEAHEKKFGKPAAVETITKKLEEKWMAKENEPVRKKFEVQSRVGNNKGYSPYLLWVANQKD